MRSTRLNWRFAVLAFVAVFFQQVAAGSFLDDAGDYSAILAASILVLGLVCGWFTRMNHGLHVVHEGVAIHVPEDEIEIVPGIELLNSSSIALSYEIVHFTWTVSGKDAISLPERGPLAYAAPAQRVDWYGKHLRVDPREFPLELEARYEVTYGRKPHWLRWWRRSIKGAYTARIPAVTQTTTILAESLDGPATDRRVPWTSISLFGWRL